MHSASFCQAQEAHQRLLARDAPLENSRAIATIAANAWAKEALDASRREARRNGGHLDEADAAIAEEFRQESEDAPTA